MTVVPAHHVAYVRYVGPYGAHGIPDLWKKFWKWMETHDACVAGGALPVVAAGQRLRAGRPAVLRGLSGEGLRRGQAGGVPLRALHAGPAALNWIDILGRLS